MKIVGIVTLTLIIPYTCVNAIYDMNGLRGPNQVGKDIGFVTVFYPNETVQAVAPMNETEDSTDTTRIKYPEANQFCTEKGKRLPNFEEGMSIVLNRGVVASVLDSMLWTLSTDGPRTVLITGLALSKKYSALNSRGQAICVE